MVLEDTDGVLRPPSRGGRSTPSVSSSTFWVNKLAFGVFPDLALVPSTKNSIGMSALEISVSTYVLKHIQYSGFSLNDRGMKNAPEPRRNHEINVMSAKSSPAAIAGTGTPRLYLWGMQ